MARDLSRESGVKIAVPVHLGRVSPLLDVAGCLLLWEVHGGRPVWRREVYVGECGLGERVRRIVETGATVVICGAVSRPLERMLVSAGVRLILQTCGPVDEVVEAYAAGRLTGASFLMPGRRRRRRRRGGRGGR
jgi:predicted Fe-Mo cluster-binding NifX family protein